MRPSSPTAGFGADLPEQRKHALGGLLSLAEKTLNEVVQRELEAKFPGGHEGERQGCEVRKGEVDAGDPITAHDHLRESRILDPRDAVDAAVEGNILDVELRIGRRCAP